MLQSNSSTISILDAGAGIGSLFSACTAQLREKDMPPKRIHVIAHEIDETLIEYLQETLDICRLACEQSSIQLKGTPF